MNPHSDRDAPALTPQAQLQSLLDYLLEQARQIDPRGFRLAAHKDFIRRRAELSGLPGVGLCGGADAGGASDDEAPWLAVERLVARPVPAFPDDDPAGRLLADSRRSVGHRPGRRRGRAGSAGGGRRRGAAVGRAAAGSRHRQGAGAGRRRCRSR